MKPIVMRSLGGMAPLRPRAEAGMKAGAAMAAPTAVAARRQKLRREILFEVLVILSNWFAASTADTVPAINFCNTLYLTIIPAVPSLQALFRKQNIKSRICKEPQIL
jgi:hypothetical protein